MLNIHCFMPSKHEKPDRSFIREFSRQLAAEYQKARASGVSHEEFAESLDVSRTGLQDFIDGKRMPTVRRLALAVDRYGIDVTYEGTSFRAVRQSEIILAPAEQLSFPFLLVTPDPRAVLRLGAVTEKTIALSVLVNKAG